VSRGIFEGFFNIAKYYIFRDTLAHISVTRNSSGDEIANVNFLYDNIVHALKIQ